MSVCSVWDLLVVREATHGRSAYTFCITPCSELFSVPAVNNLARLPVSDLQESGAQCSERVCEWGSYS